MYLYFLPVDILYKYSLCHEVLQKYLPKKVFALVLTGVVALCTFRTVVVTFTSLANRRKVQVRKVKAKVKLEFITDYLESQMVTIKPEITRLSTATLIQRIGQNKLTPSDILKAYQRQTLDVHTYTNAVTDFVIGVRDVAKSLDKWQEEYKEGLHGVPVAVDESLFLAGMDSTLGLGLYAGDLCTEDAVVVRVLKSQGALPFVRTNLPQGALSFGSSNCIFGTTTNPWNPRRSPGGPCSGGAALVARGGAVMAVGVDQGGGLRIPAHFCGVPSLKPTSRRISCRGVRLICSGQTLVPAAVGAMARDVDGLLLFFQHACAPLQNELDPYVPRMEFNTEMYEEERPLRVGYFTEDGYTQTVPAVRRAVLQACDRLRELGHTTVKFEPPDLKDVLIHLLMKSLNGDDSYRIVKHLVTDILDSSLSGLYYTVQTPHIVRWLFSWLWQRWNPIQASLLRLWPPQEVGGWWDLADDVTEFRREFTSRWQQEELDALICPVMPFAAVKLGTESSYLGTLTFVGLFSVLDFPVGSVPVTCVNNLDLEKLRMHNTYTPNTALDNRIKTDQLGYKEGMEHNSYDLPVSVQCAALPYREELVLRVLKEIQTHSSWDGGVDDIQ